MQKKLFLCSFGVFLLFFIQNCGRKGNDLSDVTSASESVASAISGSVSSSSSSASLSFLEKKRGFDFIPFLFTEKAYANTTCPTAANTACSGTRITLTYSSCSFSGAVATWNGSQIINFTTGGCSWPPTIRDVFTRTVSVGTTRTSTNNFVLTMDTTNASGYSNSVSGGYQITMGTSPARTIAINGIHVVSSKGSTTYFDHSLNTSTPLDITGTVGNLAVTGTVILQHNLAKYIATSTLNSVVFTSGCVFPTSGSLTTTLTGSVNGTETLTFSSTCGSVSYVDKDSKRFTRTLAHIY